MADEDKELPVWSVGDSWLYTFQTPQFGEDSARLVVAEIDEENGEYLLGISSEREAQRHAVINHNPFLGRLTMNGLSVYENGEPQSVFYFPWEQDSTWSFTLFDHVWSAKVTNMYQKEISVSATSEQNHVLEYTFHAGYQFITQLTWSDEEAVTQLDMRLNEFKQEYSGDVYFHRARDLLDSTYTSTDNEVYDSFFDSGHPDGSDWDVLVWYIDAEIANGGQGTLGMKDRTGASPLVRAWGSGATEKGAIGTIPSNTGEYTLTLQLRGDESYLHLRVAGAISFEWTL